FLLILHGLGGSGEQMAQVLNLKTFAQEKQFAYATPDGTPDSMGRRFWNASRVCCNFDAKEVDDVARLTHLLEKAARTPQVDRNRMFVVGYSNGGFMAHRLACEHSGTVRGIVSMAAAGPVPPETCNPEKSVAVLEIHGDRDAIVPFEGGHLFSRPEYPVSPRVREGLSPWAKRNGCRGELHTRNTVDLIEAMPGPDTEILGFDQCTGSAIQLWKVIGGAHVLQLGPVARNAIWRFILETSEIPQSG
ncbi:MAG TPA: dienelactone hydrolase family protein, partial [Polyangiaceae bacterium]|nr:dienelactone hydrolase family protein [Polyangiaceae bacterium]